MLSLSVRWINSEAKKRKTELDCHFSFISLLFTKYFEAGKNMSTEKDLFTPMKHDGILPDTNLLLLNLISLA